MRWWLLQFHCRKGKYGITTISGLYGRRSELLITYTVLYILLALYNCESASERSVEASLQNTPLEYRETYD